MPLPGEIGAPTPASGEVGRLPLFAAMALSGVAAAVPITFILLPGLRGLVAPARVGDALLGLLLMAPATVGFAVALSGLGPVSRSLSAASHAPEQAVLRIFVAALLFGHAVAIVTLFGPTPAGSRALLTAVSGLIVGWLVLLPEIVWPAASAWLRRCAMIFDASLISAFLHFGGQDAAGWYPLYLLLTAYAGFRFGIAALVGSAALGVAGFSAVAATTEFWHQQPALTAECLVALLLLPILVQDPIRAVVAARGAAAAAQNAKTRFVAVLAEALRTSRTDNPDPSHADPTAREQPELPPHVADILDLAAIDAGTYAPRSEPFDVHELVNESLAAKRGVAAGKGITLRGRIDPYLPYQLRGWRRSLDRILGNLLSHAIAVTESGAVQLRLKSLGTDGEEVRLALTIECNGEAAPALAEAMTDPFAADQRGAERGIIGLALVKRTVELMGGQITIDATPAGQTRITVELAFAVDATATEPPLQSAGCPVLIVTGDSLFAGNVCEYLGGWGAPVSWICVTGAARYYVRW